MKRLFLLVLIVVVGWFWYKGNFDLAKVQTQVENIMAKVLPTDIPQNLIQLPNSKIKLQKDAADAFVAMQESAKKDNVFLLAHSGYRSVSTQQVLWNKFLKLYGNKYTTKILKPPGESEHQTGYAIDIDDGEDLECSLKQCFKNGSAYKWLVENADKFGFEISYPENNSEGIVFEPWHWRFVGTEEAKRILKE